MSTTSNDQTNVDNTTTLSQHTDLESGSKGTLGDGETHSTPQTDDGNTARPSEGSRPATGRKKTDLRYYATSVFRKERKGEKPPSFVISVKVDSENPWIQQRGTQLRSLVESMIKPAFGTACRNQETLLTLASANVKALTDTSEGYTIFDPKLDKELAREALIPDTFSLFDHDQVTLLFDDAGDSVTYSRDWPSGGFKTDTSRDDKDKRSSLMTHGAR